MADENTILLTFKSKAFMMPENVVENCVSLAASHGMTADQLCRYYELFSFGKDYGSEVTLESIEKFNEYLRIKSLTGVTSAKKETQKKPRTLGDRTNIRSSSSVVGGHVKKEETNSFTPVAVPAALPQSSFQQRPQAGEVICCLDASLFLNKATQLLDAADGQRCAIKQLIDSPTEHVKFMQDTLPSKVNYVNRRILLKEEQLERTELLRPVGRACQEEAVFVGRICCDSEGRLNERSLLLEGSVEQSGGERMRLDVSKLQSYRLFPGQVIAIKGVNSSGHCLLAAEVDSNLCTHQQTTDAPTEPSATSELPELSVVCACGPFSTADALDYEPLEAVMKLAQDNKADVLVLLGPFVDGEHSVIAAGLLEETYEDVFQHKVVERIQGQLEQSDGGMQVVLIPSTRDVHHQPCFPQQAMRLRRHESSSHSVHSMSNPATWRCNDVVFGCTTTDILRHLAANELQRGKSGERMAGLALALLEQKSYYPLYPAALGTPLDASLGESLDMQQVPNILLLPSDLAPFAKVVHLPNTSPRTPPQQQSVVCLNPGRAIKGSSAGSCALIKIGHATQGVTQQEAPSDTFSTTCQVQVLRI